MVRASARGLIDFAKADLRSPNFWRRMRHALNDLEQQDNLRSLEWVHRRQVAQLTRPLTDESRERVTNNAIAMERIAERHLLTRVPTQEPTTHGKLESGKDMWEAAWGAPLDSPEMQARIAATVAALRK